MSGPRLKVLFVCNQNRCRSPTAEWLYERNADLSVMFAGLDPEADTPLDREALEWADRVVVFERQQRARIRRLAPDLYGRLRIECLYIPDEYEFQSPSLIALLRLKLTPLLGPPARVDGGAEGSDTVD